MLRRVRVDGLSVSRARRHGCQPTYYAVNALDGRGMIGAADRRARSGTEADAGIVAALRRGRAKTRVSHADLADMVARDFGVDNPCGARAAGAGEKKNDELTRPCDRNQATATAYERLRVGGPGGGLAVLTGFGLAGWLRRCQDAFEAPSSDPAPSRSNGRAHLHPGMLAMLLAEMTSRAHT